MIKLFSMFSGYGGAEFALKKANIDFECVGFSEIDKFAIQCYLQNHGDIKNYGDCTTIKVEELPDFDLLTGGFPCQSFSTAGNGLGELDTRGTLFHDIIRIAEAKQPKYILLENVKGLTTKKHKETFEKIISELERIGYVVNTKVLNSKNYGIPQSRDRVWFVCFRKDIYTSFEFPTQTEQTCLKSILETNVDSSYFLTKEQLLTIFHRNRWGDHFTKTTNISPTLMHIGECDVTLIVDKEKYEVEQDFINYEDKINNIMKNIREKTTEIELSTTIRRLTPKECFRLMGFVNDEIDLSNISKSRAYKIAGNGWDINIASKLFINMNMNIFKVEE